MDRLIIFTVLAAGVAMGQGPARYFPDPPAITAGAATITLMIPRTGGEIGYSADEMNTFNFYGPTNPYPAGPPAKLPTATLINPNLLSIVINEILFSVPGAATIVYTADPFGTPEKRLIAWTINPPPSLNGAATKGRVGNSYDADLRQQGGTPPNVVSVRSGGLPPGLRIVDNANPISTHLTGTPTLAGTFPAILRIVDKFGVFYERDYSVTIVPRYSITTPSLPQGVVGVRYQKTMEGTGGVPPYMWFDPFSGATTRIGLALDASGNLTGTPLAAGTYSVTVRMLDAADGDFHADGTVTLNPNTVVMDQKTYSLVIVGPVTITTASLPAGGKGAAYSATLQATGGTAPYQWSLGAGTTLPAGLTLTSAGVISGTPTVTGTFNVTVRAADASTFDQKTFPLVIQELGPFVTVHAATFLEATGGAPVAIVTGYGKDLAPSLAATPGPNLPTSLLDISVTVNGATAPLFFVSPQQINYLVPAGVASGTATVMVKKGALPIAQGTLRVQPVAPGLFTANADGLGVAAADLIRAPRNLPQVQTFVFTCGAAAGSCVPLLIDLNSPDEMYLLLFGTGIRGRTSLGAVTVTVGGVSIPVLYAGPQSEYPGLDQINLGPLPVSLRGRGKVDVRVRVDGIDLNVVNVAFQ